MRKNFTRVGVLSIIFLGVIALVQWRCGGGGNNNSVGGNTNTLNTELQYADGTPIPGGTWWINFGEFLFRSGEPLALDDSSTGLTCDDVPEADAADSAAAGCIDADGDTFLANPCSDTSADSTQSFLVDVMDGAGNQGNVLIDCSAVGTATDDGTQVVGTTDIVNPTPTPTPTPAP